MTSSNQNLIFSGHDSFHCRQLWLKKGYDFLVNGNGFNDPDSVVNLGVGKNMVSSIRFWLRAFYVVDDKDDLTEFSKLMFDDEKGYDPFLEDESSLWLLHYQLLKTGYSSIYSIIFNEFRKEKLFFDKEIFINFMKRLIERESVSVINENTLAKDFSVFVNLYKSNSNSNAVEDSLSGILSEIELLDFKGRGKQEQLYIENTERDSLSSLIVLYAILDNPNYGNSITLNSLEFDANSPGSIFGLNRSGLINKLSEIADRFEDITFTDQAGVMELQFKNKIEANTILDSYYGK